MQFVVNDTQKYNYNGEIEEKLKDMGRPNLVRIRQKQACFLMMFVTTIAQLTLLYIVSIYYLPTTWIVLRMCQSMLKAACSFVCQFHHQCNGAPCAQSSCLQ